MAASTCAGVGGVLNWSGLPQEWGVLHIIRTPNRITQIWYNDNTASTAGTVFRRMWESNTPAWTPQYRMLDSRSAVGAITRHTDGQPTGPIIERGSFASGDYMRLADGTQICWRAGTFSALATDTTVSETWTFPAPFSAPPFCWSEHPATVNPHLAWSSAQPISAVAATISARHSLGSISDRAAYFYAIGRQY